MNRRLVVALIGGTALIAATGVVIATAIIYEVSTHDIWSCVADTDP